MKQQLITKIMIVMMMMMKMMSVIMNIMIIVCITNLNMQIIITENKEQHKVDRLNGTRFYIIFSLI